MKLILCLTILAVIAGPASAQNLAVGVNAAIRNSVSMKTVADADLRPARLHEAVHLGDQIATGPTSQIQVLLRDKSVFTLGANARMAIDRFVYDPARKTGDIATSVVRGAFRFMSRRGLSNGGGAAAINSPVATIGVRGTIVEGVIGPDALAILADQPGIALAGSDPETVTLVVLRGPGRRTDGHDKIGAIDVSAAGTMIAVQNSGSAVLVRKAGEAPIGPFRLSVVSDSRMVALLGSAPDSVTDAGRPFAPAFLDDAVEWAESAGLDTLDFPTGLPGNCDPVRQKCF